MTNAQQKVYELVRDARRREDTAALSEIRDHYGYDLYIEALRKVTTELTAKDQITDQRKE